MSANRVVDEHLVSPVLVYTSSGGVFKNELLLSAQGGILREQIGDLLVVKNDFSVVSSLTGSNFTGPVIFSSGLTGSLQVLENGSPYLQAGDGITIVTRSDGSITISSDIEGSIQNIFSGTGSVVFGGDVFIEGTLYGGSPLDISSEAVFHSGALFQTGLTGSLTTLVDGSPYLVAGEGITITTGTIGQITISVQQQQSQSVTNVLTDIVLNETLTGVADGSNMLFFLDNTPATNSSVMIWMNGQLLTQGFDYSVSGKNISFILSPPQPGDSLIGMYSKAVQVKKFSMNETATQIEVLGSPALQIARVPEPVQSLMLFRNGQLLTQNIDFVVDTNRIAVTNNAIENEDVFLATYSYVE
jgi:hypothetical protein